MTGALRKPNIFLIYVASLICDSLLLLTDIITTPSKDQLRYVGHKIIRVTHD